MADVFTGYVIQQTGTIATWLTACKTYLDTLTAANIDTIQIIAVGHQMRMVVVSHA